MHQTRAKTDTKIPIPRKGTKYVVRPLGNIHSGVSVLIALRDMLHLAANAREVKHMIRNKLIKINGRPVRDHRQSILIFNILTADKNYLLTLLPTGKFTFKEKKDMDRILKVIGKKKMSGGKVQVNFHDGTNMITSKDINVGDSIVISEKGELLKSLPLEKGKKVFVYSGKSIGQEGTVGGVEGKKVSIELEGGKVTLDKSHVIVI